VLARADGTYARTLARLARVDVLVIDDWGHAPMRDQERRDLVEVVDDRIGLRSTVMTSQLPIAKLHDHIGDPTNDAICDRVLSSAHPFVLKGPSLTPRTASVAALRSRCADLGNHDGAISLITMAGIRS
jgi:DNA replication protein DnaC